MTSAHLTEDDLVLHYYGEMPSAEDAAASAHLQACTSCRREFVRLQRVLGVIEEPAVSVEPSPSFERTVWARLEPNLRPRGRRWIPWLVASPAPLALAAAVVVLIVGAFLAGRALSPPSSPNVEPVAGMVAAEHIRERILLVDLGVHLDRSQMVLVELVSGGAGADFSAERARAEQLVADNRLYRLTAAETGDTLISELLDEIERVLTEIAASPARTSATDLDGLRRRIESRDLLFKVRVVSSEVRERQKEALRRRTGQSS